MSTTPLHGGAASAASAGCGTTWSRSALDEDSGGYHRFAWTREDHDLREWFAGRVHRPRPRPHDRPHGQPVGLVGRPGCRGRRRRPRRRHRVAPGLGARRRRVRRPARRRGRAGRDRPAAARPASPRPARSGVVNFADEEGARFGVACAGSRVITGALGADRARGLTDRDGVTMAEAMRRAGRDPATLGRDDETLARIGTFVELHVEQGRPLVDLGHAGRRRQRHLAARPLAGRRARRGQPRRHRPRSTTARTPCSAWRP